MKKVANFYTTKRMLENGQNPRGLPDSVRSPDAWEKTSGISITEEDLLYVREMIRELQREGRRRREERFSLLQN